MFQILRNGSFVEIEHLANQGKVGSHLLWQNARNSLVSSLHKHEALYFTALTVPSLFRKRSTLRSARPCPLSLWIQTLCTMGPWTVLPLVSVPPRCPHCCHLQLGEAILNSSCTVVGVWLMFLRGRLVGLFCAF